MQNILPSLRHRAPSWRAFSLIEAAIVLGIIGLVIGGIWAATTAINSSRKTSNAVSGINSIIFGLGQLYKGQALPTPFTDLTPTLLATGVIPQDWASGNSSYSPFGGPFEVVKLSNSNMIYIGLYRVPARDCAKLIFNLTGPTNSEGYGKYGLAYTVINGTYSNTTYPLVQTLNGPAAYMKALGDDCNAGGATVNLMVHYVFPYAGA